MGRGQLEQLLNSLMGKKIVIKMDSTYCGGLIYMQPESIKFKEGIRKSRVSDSLIEYRNVSILDKKAQFSIEYEEIENIKYKDFDRNQFYEIQLIYRDGTMVQLYSKESF